MSSQLPPTLLRLFAPRPPLEYLKPNNQDPGKRLPPPKYTGLAAVLPFCQDHDKDYKPTETLAQRKKRIAEERALKAQEDVKQKLETWDPHSDKNATSDPYKTLLVARLSKDTTEKRLRRIFEDFGSVKNVRLIVDKKGQSRGYAFIEFSKESDMKRAYRDADGMKIDDRRIIIDVERGRTVKDWKPRRLGGGLGGTRIGYAWENKAGSSREPDQPSSSAGGGYSREDKYSGGGGYRDRRGGDDRYGGSRRDDYHDRRTSRGDSYNDRGSRGDSYGSRGDSYNDRSQSRHRSRSPRRDRDYHSSRYR